MIEWIKITSLKAPFSKWIVMDKGVHLMPEQYTPYAKNIRISNSTTTKRKWYVRVVKKWKYEETTNGTTSTVEVTDKFIDNMISDWTYLYAVCDGKLYKVDFNDDMTMTKYWDHTLNSDVYALRYGKYLYFLSEETAKGYYVDTSAWTGGALTISEDAYFRFGEVYKQNVYLAGGKDKSNVLYMSRAGSKANPSNILDFNGSGSDALYMKSKIIWLSATREQLFVFTEDSIEIISYTDSWGTLTLISVPIAWNNQPANPRMVVKTDDLVFFWTKYNQMKSLNYMQWVTERVVGDVSHRPNLSIKDFTDTLDEDQSTSFGYYDRGEKTIHRHLKQKWEPMPNVVLVYDMNTDWFFIDTNKFFRCATTHDNKYYAWSSFWTIIYQDNKWPTDDGSPIERQRRTALLSVGSPDYRKEFRQVNIYWEKSDDVDIEVKVLVDGMVAFSWDIKASWGSLSWFASSSIWEDMVAFETGEGGVKRFEYIITRGNMRARWKNIQILFNWKSIWDFCLSWIEIWYKELYDIDNKDRAKPNI